MDDLVNHADLREEIADEFGPNAAICGAQAPRRMPTPWISTSGSPLPVSAKAVPCCVWNRRTVIISGRCRIVDVVAEVLEVLVAIADAMMWTAADRSAERDQDFARRRRIGD